MIRLIRLTAAALALTTLTATAQSEPAEPVLRLEQLVDGRPARTVTLYASDIDPNSRSVTDRYRLTVDGRAVALPHDLAARLDHARRAYSYDAVTNGISTTTALAVCKMAGPSKGWMLSTRYLTYDDHKITGSDMRPVLSRAENCLFDIITRPNSDDARFEASGALATLLTLAELNRN